MPGLGCFTTETLPDVCSLLGLGIYHVRGSEFCGVPIQMHSAATRTTFLALRTWATSNKALPHSLSLYRHHLGATQAQKVSLCITSQDNSASRPAYPQNISGQEQADCCSRDSKAKTLNVYRPLLLFYRLEDNFAFIIFVLTLILEDGNINLSV